MIPKILLDTHVVIHWAVEPRKLSREQRRVVEGALARHEVLAVSPISLLEIAALEEAGKLRREVREIFEMLQSTPVFQILPITYDIAIEAGRLGILRDPADRAMVATAIVHRLRLVTSDQRIIASNLVSVVE